MVADIPTKIGLGASKARLLKDIGVTTVQFSFDCVEPETINFMVGVEDYHRKAFRALENLRCAGLKVRINAVLTPYNADVAALVRYAGELGNVIQLTISPYGRSLFKHDDRLFVNDTILERVKETVASLSPCYPHMRINVGGAGSPPPEDPEQRKLAWSGRAFCTANRHSFVILPDGRVTVCEELYDHPAFIIGDLRKQTVMEMWNSAEAKALLHPDQSKIPDGPCAECNESDLCNGTRGRCWRDVIKSYGLAKYYYPDPRCSKAPIGRRLG